MSDLPNSVREWRFDLTPTERYCAFYDKHIDEMLSVRIKVERDCHMYGEKWYRTHRLPYNARIEGDS